MLLGEQDRSRWDADAIREGRLLVVEALTGAGAAGAGPYSLQAAIAAVHDEAAVRLCHFPAGQSAHALDPAAAENLPDAQSAHVSVISAVPALKRPAAHAVHTAVFALSLTW